jgi:rare lipoprotein A
LRFVYQSRLARIAGGPSSDAGAFGPAGCIAPLLLTAALCLGLAACGSGNNERLGERVIPLGQPVPKGGGVYHVGKPYEIAGLTYTPREEPGYDRVGNASWYGELFHGRRTANGEIYDMESLTAAHPTLPLPVYARVTNLNNGRSIVVRINDRGPYARDRIIDLSRRSAELLAFRTNGTATVRVKYLGRAPLNGDDSYERNYLASQGWMRVANRGKSPKDRAAAIAINRTLPAENPENLARPWKQAALLPSPAPQAPSSPPAALAAPQSTASIPALTSAKLQGPGVVIQAGSFKNKENAERARTALAALAPVEVTPIEVGGGGVYFRVRVGPFATAGSKTALTSVRNAGYQGAKIVSGD